MTGGRINVQTDNDRLQVARFSALHQKNLNMKIQQVFITLGHLSYRQCISKSD